MKYIILPIIVSSALFGADVTLYVDSKTKQIFMEDGEGRQKIGTFTEKSNDADQMSKELKSVPITSKAKSLEISGTHYLGFTSNQYGSNNANGGSSSAGFEFRRNYLDVKANIGDKQYAKITLDAKKELESSANANGQTSGYANAYVKYAYLYFGKIPFMPNTSAEFGVVHRPWIGYEEHNGWYWRSIDTVLVESKFSCYQSVAGASTTTCVGPDIINSADLGINLNTKTDYVSAELGVYNGEGYHADKAAANQANSNTGQLSYEWRLTAHLFGDGKKVGKYDVTKDTYAHLSFAGMSSKNHKDNNLAVGDASEFDREGYWLHGVYNHPFALIAAQVGEVKDKARNIAAANDAISKTYTMWSVNTDIRPIKDWTVIARYDDLKTKYPNLASSHANNAKDKGDATQWIAGVAHKYNKNINFIASYKQVDAKESTAVQNTTVGAQLDKKTYMFTTEVKW